VPWRSAGSAAWGWARRANIVNDPAQSPIAAKVHVHGFPGDGRTIGVTHVYFLTTAYRDREWAWKLLQYLGGKTQDGEYTQVRNLAADAMLGSGYRSVMESDAILEGWKPWGDPTAILEMWNKASYVGEPVSSVYEPWHFPWTDQLNIEVQNGLTGQITADQACDNPDRRDRHQARVRGGTPVMRSVADPLAPARVVGRCEVGQRAERGVALPVMPRLDPPSLVIPSLAFA
jgi:hypothetical protein